MANFLTFLPFNTSSLSILPDSINPKNAVRAERSEDGIFDAKQKHHFHYLIQAEDKFIEFSYTVNGKPLVDLSEVELVIFTLDGKETLRYSLEDNIDEYAGLITVWLSDEDTISMIGKYSYELWLKDSQNTDTLIFTGSMKFKPTKGRII